ncbi:hypothetical protein D3C77_590060 [compost metagenome]
MPEQDRAGGVTEQMQLQFATLALQVPGERFQRLAQQIEPMPRQAAVTGIAAHLRPDAGAQYMAERFYGAVPGVAEGVVEAADP